MSEASVQQAISVRDVERAIEAVLDPCSRFNGTRLSFVDLGMVDAIELDEIGHVRVRLLLDDPTCLYIFEIQKEMREAVLRLRGVESVEIDIRADELWTEERATDETRRKLQRRRNRQSRLIPVDSLRLPAHSIEKGGT